MNKKINRRMMILYNNILYIDFIRQQDLIQKRKHVNPTSYTMILNSRTHLSTQ